MGIFKDTLDRTHTVLKLGAKWIVISEQIRRKTVEI